MKDNQEYMQLNEPYRWGWRLIQTPYAGGLFAERWAKDKAFIRNNPLAWLSV